jgi:thioredoxin reductase (NADPH)
MVEKSYDLIVIGAAAAGLTAAIYSARRTLKTLVLSRNLGGQASLAPQIENYPGFERISGYDLMKSFERQAKDFGAEIVYESVTKINPEKEGFVIATNNSQYRCKAIILAFGKTPRTLNVPREKEFEGKGISYCATCDMPLFRDKIVGVVGGGFSAIDAALYGSDVAKRVYLIDKESSIGNDLESKKIKERKNIEIMVNTNVIEFKGDNFLKSVIVENMKTKERKEIKVEGFFVEIGSEVKREIVKDLVKLDQNNQVAVNERCETFYPNSDKIRPGIFAAGDVTTVPYKQVVISAGEGAKASLEAYCYVKGMKLPFMADWSKMKK